MVNYFKELRSLSVTGINAKNTGATQIGATENGTEKFHPLFAVFVMNSASLITIVPTVSVGTNGATYNNILAATALAGVSGVGSMLPVVISSAISNISANTGIFVNVTIGATATTALLDCHIIGFYN